MIRSHPLQSCPLCGVTRPFVERKKLPPKSFFEDFCSIRSPSTEEESLRGDNNGRGDIGLSGSVVVTFMVVVLAILLIQVQILLFGCFGFCCCCCCCCCCLCVVSFATAFSARGQFDLITSKPCVISDCNIRI